MKIEKFNPCSDGLEWYNTQPDFKTAWDNCHRGDWMLWMAQKIGVNKRLLTLAKGKCAETVIHLMKDERSVAAVRAAIDYGNGIIDDEQLKTAAAAAAAAAVAAAAAAAADAVAAYTDAVAVAAYAVAVAVAAYADAYAAYTAAAAYTDVPAAAYTDVAAAAADAVAAAVAADAAAAKKENQQKTADICREILTSEVMKLIKEQG